MNSGRFTPGAEQTRPGIYFNFSLLANDRISGGARGRVALPLKLSWGPSKEIVEISSDQDSISKLGVSMSDPALLLLREAKKMSQTVLAYRLNEGVKAKASLGQNQTVTALYGGEKGDEITITVATHVLDETKKEVKTFFYAREVDSQIVEKFEDLKSNNHVTFVGSGTLQNTAGAKLKDGADGTVLAGDYADFLTACESGYFDVVALPTDDDDIKTTFVSFVKRLREDLGIKITGILANYEANYEGITNVINGVTLTSGQKLSASEAVAWVAGASAGATLRQSLTFMTYEGATDVNKRLEHSEIEEALRNGKFLFNFDSRDGTVAVEQDINSLRGTTKFSKNKIIRIIDAIHNDIYHSLKQTIKNRKTTGTDIPADSDGKSIVKTAVAMYLNELQDGNIIKNFTLEDIQIDITPAGDGFLINLAVQPVDSGEKFYFNVDVI